MFIENPNIAKQLPYLHDTYVVVPAVKAPNGVFNATFNNISAISWWYNVA
jgi:hypothetical protein